MRDNFTALTVSATGKFNEVEVEKTWVFYLTLVMLAGIFLVGLAATFWKGKNKYYKSFDMQRNMKIFKEKMAPP